VLQDYLFCPRIMGRHLRIHPLAPILAILVGGEVGGIVGVYLAIPVMASVQVIWQMCAAREPIAAESRRRPAATTGLSASLTERVVVCVEAIPVHAKTD